MEANTLKLYFVVALIIAAAILVAGIRKRRVLLVAIVILATFLTYRYVQSRIEYFGSLAPAHVIVESSSVTATDRGSDGMLWNVSMTLRETAGGRGARCNGYGYIEDVKGNRWETPLGGGMTFRVYSGELVIKPGMSAVLNTQASSLDHEICNGALVVDWTCTDWAGEETTVRAKAVLVHKDCPKLK